MSKLTTISLNLSDGTKEIISVTDNTPEILAECIRSASEGKTIYSVTGAYRGYQIRRKLPDRVTHDYVSGYKNGEFSWVSDYLYAKHFSKATAIAHTKKLFEKGE